VKRLLGATLMLGGLLGACASAETVGPAAPNLPLMSQPTPSSYPELRSVPTSHEANTDPGHWAQVRSEVLAAVADLRDHPRSVYGSPPEDPAIFLNEAREDLMESRDSH
jgi:hypothetical protein